MALDMKDIDNFLLSKGTPVANFEDTAPYEVLRMFANYSDDMNFFDHLYKHFGRRKYDEKEALEIMDKFDSELKNFVNRESLTESESITVAALLDIIFSFEAWLCTAGTPKEWGWSAPFRQFDENLFILNSKTEIHLTHERIKKLSDARTAPTVLSAINNNVDSAWAGEQFESGYDAMFSNSPNLPAAAIHRALENGDSTVIFHKNADPKIAKKYLLEMLDQDPDPIIEQLHSWQTMYENGWYFITPWSAYSHSKNLLKTMNVWLEEHDYEETVEDFLGFADEEDE